MPVCALSGCISFDSYIKPQLYKDENGKTQSCISFDSYIKPQLDEILQSGGYCCISFDSYIKPQLGGYHATNQQVVYLLIPTSNHNVRFFLS